MSDQRPVIAFSTIRTQVGAKPGPGQTTVRCSGCGVEGVVETASLPLVKGLTPIRDADGTRTAWCARCQRPNRAERRRKR